MKNSDSSKVYAIVAIECCDDFDFNELLDELCDYYHLRFSYSTHDEIKMLDCVDYLINSIKVKE